MTGLGGTSDAANTYTWDWRGRLASIEVKDVGPGLDPARDPYPGERIAYAYDAIGRLLSRTELGKVPEGGTEADRPFIAKRAFTWDGQRLAAEAGLNFQDQPIWREQYAPGQRGLDDAPLVRVEKDLQGTPTAKTYALLRDEMGSVMAVAEERAGQSPNLLARYLYAPYGQAHTELGPELVRIEFDPSVTKVANQAQATTPNETVGGALEIVTTTALLPSTFAAGLTIEQWNPSTSGWEASPRSDYAIGMQGAGLGDGTIWYVMRIQGWAKATKYRMTLLPSLTDSFGRAIVLPSGESQGVAVTLDVPSDGITPPAYARIFPLNYAQPASDTLGGAFPGGQTSGFQGAWSDPISGLGFPRARWMDRVGGGWLAQDPEGAALGPQLSGSPLDSQAMAGIMSFARLARSQQASQNAYGGFRWSPVSQSDPLGLWPKPYNVVSGFNAHRAFFTWVMTTPWWEARAALGDTLATDMPLASLLGLDDIKWRPDLVHYRRNRSGGEYYELKPFTHNLAGAIHPRDARQLNRYDSQLAALGIVRGDFWDVIGASGGSRGVPFPVPYAVKDFDGEFYLMEVLGPQTPAQLGLVYYRLQPTGEKETIPESLKQLMEELSKALRQVPPPDYRKLPPVLPLPVPVPVLAAAVALL
jgi:hypothetical protein